MFLECYPETTGKSTQILNTENLDDIIVVKSGGKIRLIARLNSVKTVSSNKYTINMSHKVNLSPATTVDAPFPFVGVSATDTVELWTKPK